MQKSIRKVEYKKELNDFCDLLVKELANIHAGNSYLHRDLHVKYIKSAKYIAQYRNTIANLTDDELLGELTPFAWVWNMFYKDSFTSSQKDFPELMEFSYLRLKKEETLSLFKKHHFFERVPNSVLINWLKQETDPKAVLLELVSAGFDIDKQQRKPLEAYKPNSISPYFLRDIGMNPFISQAIEQDLKNFTTDNNLEDLHVKHKIDLFGIEPTLLCSAIEINSKQSIAIAQVLIDLGADVNKMYVRGGTLAGSTFAYVDGAGSYYYGYESALSIALEKYSAYDSDDINEKKMELISSLIYSYAKVEPTVFYYKHPLANAIKSNNTILLNQILSACRIEKGGTQFENWNKMAIKYIAYAAKNAEDEILEVLCEHNTFKELDICLAKKGKSILINKRDNKDYTYFKILQERGLLDGIKLSENEYAPAAVSMVKYSGCINNEDNYCKTPKEALDKLGISHIEITNEEIEEYILSHAVDGL